MPAALHTTPRYKLPHLFCSTSKWFMCVCADTEHVRRCLGTMSWPPRRGDFITTLQVRLLLSLSLSSLCLPLYELTVMHLSLSLSLSLSQSSSCCPVKVVFFYRNCISLCPPNRVGGRRGRLRGSHELQWVRDCDNEQTEVVRGEENLAQALQWVDTLCRCTGTFHYSFICCVFLFFFSTI